MYPQVCGYLCEARDSPLLEDNGVEGYVLEDAADFEEFLKDTEIYWDYVDEDLVREKRAQETCLKIYLPDSDEGAKQYADIRAALENLKARDEEHAWGRLCTETALTRQEDWEWGWKQYFKPFPVGRGFMIKPSWETVEDPQGRRILEIDPASSFGTGSHDTTQLDDGSGTPRQILSGIAKYYKPEELVGKTVVAVTNLPPRKMMGQESNGMLLSAEKDEKLNLLMLDDSIAAGSKLC